MMGLERRLGRFVAGDQLTPAPISGDSRLPTIPLPGCADASALQWHYTYTHTQLIQNNKSFLKGGLDYKLQSVFQT